MKHPEHRIGIEAVALALPRRYIALEDLAAARGVDPAKYTTGLGASQMAVAHPGEDTVALAATAAARLLRTNDVDPARLGMLVVGTETAVDHAKPVASYVQGLLGLPPSMRTFDTQHACYGGTAALMAASDWIASGSARGRSAVVICADVARYGLRTPGEPTQGGGAVAILVSDRPELLALDGGVAGAFSTHVHDFWRPLGRREPYVDGHYSIDCYLGAIEGAYTAWRDLALRRGVVEEAGLLPSEQLRRIVYHAPFCKMARKAHARVRACDLSLRHGDPLLTAIAERESTEGLASFDRQVARSLDFAARIGNMYTASLYCGLASLLHSDAAELAGQRIGLFSYGSGCSSEFFSAVVGQHAARVVARAGLDDALRDRVRIDVAEYEHIMSLPGDAPLHHDAWEGAFRFVGLEGHRRTYAGDPILS